MHYACVNDEFEPLVPYRSVNQAELGIRVISGFKFAFKNEILPVLKQKKWDLMLSYWHIALYQLKRVF